MNQTAGNEGKFVGRDNMKTSAVFIYLKSFTLPSKKDVYALKIFTGEFPCGNVKISPVIQSGIAVHAESHELPDSAGHILRGC